MIRKFLALSRADRSLLLQGAIVLPVVAVLLRLFNFSRLSKLLDRGKAASSGDPACIPHATRMLNAAANHGLVHYTCLEKSLALQWLLRRRGIETDLRLGARKDPDFEAHAWLEVQGIPINDTDVRERYAPFPTRVSTPPRLRG